MRCRYCDTEMDVITVFDAEAKPLKRHRYAGDYVEKAKKCTWCGREENLDKSPLFGAPVCDRCWEAEEEAYIEVIGDLERNIDKTHRWPMYWRVLEKVAENPWEHIPLIKLAKKTREEKANDNRLEARMVAPNEVYSGKVWRSDQKGCKNQNQYSRG